MSNDHPEPTNEGLQFQSTPDVRRGARSETTGSPIGHGEDREKPGVPTPSKADMIMGTIVGVICWPFFWVGDLVNSICAAIWRKLRGKVRIYRINAPMPDNPREQKEFPERNGRWRDPLVEDRVDLHTVVDRHYREQGMITSALVEPLSGWFKGGPFLLLGRQRVKSANLRIEWVHEIHLRRETDGTPYAVRLKGTKEVRLGEEFDQLLLVNGRFARKSLTLVSAKDAFGRSFIFEVQQMLRMLEGQIPGAALSLVALNAKLGAAASTARSLVERAAATAQLPGKVQEMATFALNLLEDEERGMTIPPEHKERLRRILEAFENGPPGTDIGG